MFKATSCGNKILQRQIISKVFRCNFGCAVFYGSQEGQFPHPQIAGLQFAETPSRILQIHRYYNMYVAMDNLDLNSLRPKEVLQGPIANHVSPSLASQTLTLRSV